MDIMATLNRGGIMKRLMVLMVMLFCMCGSAWGLSTERSGLIYYPTSGPSLISMNAAAESRGYPVTFKLTHSGSGVSTPYYIASGVTFSDLITIEREYGAVLVADNAVITLDCKLSNWGSGQAFEEIGTGYFTGSPSGIDEVRPSWFGVEYDYDYSTFTGTDNTKSYQEVVNFAVRSGIQIIQHELGSFMLTEPIYLQEGLNLGKTGGKYNVRLKLNGLVRDEDQSAEISSHSKLIFRPISGSTLFVSNNLDDGTDMDLIGLIVEDMAFYDYSGSTEFAQSSVFLDPGDMDSSVFLYQLRLQMRGNKFEGWHTVVDNSNKVYMDELEISDNLFRACVETLTVGNADRGVINQNTNIARFSGDNETTFANWFVRLASGRGTSIHNNLINGFYVPNQPQTGASADVLTGHAIVLSACENVEITNNYTEAVNLVGMFNCEDITIEDNYFRDRIHPFSGTTQTAYAVDMYLGSSPSNMCKNISLINNTFLIGHESGGYDNSRYRDINIRRAAAFNIYLTRYLGAIKVEHNIFKAFGETGSDTFIRAPRVYVDDVLQDDMSLIGTGVGNNNNGLNNPVITTTLNPIGGDLYKGVELNGGENRSVITQSLKLVSDKIAFSRDNSKLGYPVGSSFDAASVSASVLTSAYSFRDSMDEDDDPIKIDSVEYYSWLDYPGPKTLPNATYSYRIGFSFNDNVSFTEFYDVSHAYREVSQTISSGEGALTLNLRADDAVKNDITDLIVLRTDDAGATWSGVSVPIEELIFQETIVPDSQDSNIWDFAFHDDGTYTFMTVDIADYNYATAGNKTGYQYDTNYDVLLTPQFDPKGYYYVSNKTTSGFNIKFESSTHTGGFMNVLINWR